MLVHGLVCVQRTGRDDRGMDNYLLVFFKYPEVGAVKTRLARGIGAKRAAQLYRLFVEVTLERTSAYACPPDCERICLHVDTHRQARTGRYEQLLFYTPEERKSETKSWINRGRGGATLPLHPQIGSDLGERMLNALKTAFSNGAKKAVIIGTDSPTLDKETICEAFYRLKDNDVVIGPTVDGGYYLIGASLPAPEGLFINIDWGSARVFEQTIKRVNEENASYSLLPLHYDVDNLEDLRILKEEIVRMDGVKRRGFLAIYKMLTDDLLL